jgi:hypothetical protein
MAAASRRKKMKLPILALLTCLVASANGKKVRGQTTPETSTIVDVPMDATPISVEIPADIPEGIANASVTSEMQTFANASAPLQMQTFANASATSQMQTFANASATSQMQTFAMVNGKCADQYPATCWSWKNQGYCTNTYYYGTQFVMTDLCPVTCGRCGK